MTLTERTILTLTLVIAVAISLIQSTGLGPIARTAPLLVGLPTLALLSLELVRDSVRGQRKPVDHDLAIVERRLIGWLALMVGLVATIGIALGTAAWLALYLRVRSGERWAVASGFGVGLAVVLYAVLTLVLRIPVSAGGLLNF